MKKNLTLFSILFALFIFSGCGKSLKTDLTPPVGDNTSSNIQNENILPGNSIKESGVKDISIHSGSFALTMSGYKGELFIGIADGRFYGTIKFSNWGNGIPQPLINLKVNEDKIYFRRVIKTKQDLIKYGGTDYFDQEFYGIFTPDKKTIKGYYRYIGTQDNWDAVKKGE